MIRIITIASLALAATFGPAVAKCDTMLKPTDDYQELSAKLACLNAEIAELRKVIFPKGASAPAAPPTVASAVQESGGVRIELERCAKSGGAIDCRIHITSTEKDQKVSMDSSVIAVDNAGVTYRWRGFQKVGESGMESGGNSRWYVTGVRTAATISYSAQTEQDATSLPALQISIAPEGGQYRLITFRNVALQ